MSEMNTAPVATRWSTDKAVAGGIIAVVGSGVTVALGVLPDHTTPLWLCLTILSGMLTSAGVLVGVYQVPNKPITDGGGQATVISNDHLQAPVVVTAAPDPAAPAPETPPGL